MLDDNRTINPESPAAASPQALFRGMYVRIAARLNVDPSYVSRVARGERRSLQVEKAIRDEVEQIGKKLARDLAPAGRRRSPEVDSGTRRLRYFVQKSKPRLSRDWLQQTQADSRIRKVKLTVQQRVDPFLKLLEEQMRLMKYNPRELVGYNLKAANAHGELRRGQGYSTTALLEEYNLMRRCVFTLAEENQTDLDPRYLIHDLAQLGEVLDLQTQAALVSYLKQ